MKKAIIGAVLGIFLPIIIFLFLILGIFGGMGGGNITPANAIATQEEAALYREVCDEIDVPWDIVLLCDSIYANENKIDSLEDFNPLLTALEFFVISEDIYKWDEDIIMAPVLQPDGSYITKPVPAGDWEYDGDEEYTGKTEVLEYISETEEEFNTDAENIVKDIMDAAVTKGSEEYQYEVSVEIATDYETVLRDCVELSEENISYVMALYDAKFMELLFPLPKEGDVADNTRAEEE